VAKKTAKPNHGCDDDGTLETLVATNNLLREQVVDLLMSILLMREAERACRDADPHCGLWSE
jgi:hypothetical protein